MRTLLTLLVALAFSVLPALAQEDEIVANLAGGRVIILVAANGIVFGAIDHPLEAKSVPPRVATIGSTHVGIFFGASEWQVPAQPMPIRLDKNVADLRSTVNTKQTYRPEGTGDPDLELIGVGFLEKLRPLASQLHHKYDLKPDEPLLEIVLIGYGPSDYGPEAWLIEYHAEQQSVSNDFWQTHLLRPRFTQIYPPGKHEAKTIVETRFPPDLQAVPLAGLLQQNDPRIAQVRADQRMNKVAQFIEHGQANKVSMQDAADFLRATLPFLAGSARFIEGQLGETGGFDWIVPPEEPREKAKRDENRPPDAPTLFKKPNPDQ